MANMKKLPLGIQTFRDIRDLKENYVYIDKTAIAHQLVTEQKYAFLSRPRRFGKSLFLDTVSELFKGSKELFEGLAIYDKWDWTEQYPVIRISFGTGDFSSKENILSSIKLTLQLNCQDLDVEVGYDASLQIGGLFRVIIRAVYERYNKKVVILIDEYDKPILDTIHKNDKTTSSDARDVLRDFYSVIKDSDQYLKFVMLTGVSKFSKLNLFSGLNNITDITIDKKYATITGYTHADIQHHFAEHLKGVDLEEVRRWYNGYNYFGEPIYNPYDILLFISNDCTFKNYWWTTGNPSFLIELLKKEPRFLPLLETVELSEEQLGAFDIEYIDLCALLWQTGYLTFDKINNLYGFYTYTLKVPNLEVQKSLNTLFLDYLTDLHTERIGKQTAVIKALVLKKVDEFHKQLVSLFASISHHNYTNNLIASYEGYYASVVYAFLASLGFDIVAEDTTNIGRIDMTIKTPNHIYILEFKVDMPAEKALEQCHTNKYYHKYLSENKSITLLGIHFDSSARQIAEFVSEEVNQNSL